MSRREGIGKKYLLDNWGKIWNDKGVWIATEKGGKLKNIPAYFNKQYRYYYEEIDKLTDKKYLKSLNPYDERQYENQNDALERIGTKLRETSLTEEEYRKQHAEILHQNLRLFTRTNAEGVEDTEQYKVEITDKRLPEEHYNSIKEMKLALRAKRAGRKKRFLTKQRKAMEEMLKYMEENEYIYNPFKHKFEKFPF